MKREPTFAKIIWALAAIVSLVAVARFHLHRGENLWAPEEGEVLSLDSISAAFGIPLPRVEETWLLVVTSDCDGCLRLDPLCQDSCRLS